MLREAAVVCGSGHPLRPIAPMASSEPDYPGYDAHCFLTGEMETREKNWHDLLNAMVWLAFPRTKAALNARHYRSQQTSRGQNQRGTHRDALTLFDECGVIICSDDDSLLDLLKNFAWKELFWHRRADVLARMRVYIFGHGLYEQALKPFIGLTGKALLLPVDQTFLRQSANAQIASIDETLCQLIADPNQFNHPRDLSPLPILGVPGWAVENNESTYYDNTDYFRPGRRKAMAQ